MTPSRGPNLRLLQFAVGAFPQSKENHQARQEVFWKNNSLTAVFFSGLGWALLQILFPFWALTAKSIVTFSCRPGGWEGRLAVYMCWATIRRFCLGPVKLKQHYLTDCRVPIYVTKYRFSSQITRFARLLLGGQIAGLVQGQLRTSSGLVLDCRTCLSELVPDCRTGPRPVLDRGGRTTSQPQKNIARTIPDCWFWFPGLLPDYVCFFRPIGDASGLPGLVAGQVCQMIQGTAEINQPIFNMRWYDAVVVCPAAFIANMPQRCGFCQILDALFPGTLI